MLSFIGFILFTNLLVHANTARLPEIRVPVRNIPAQVDPSTILDSHSALIAGQIFESLYEYTELNTLRPVLVERHLIQNSGKTILLHLRRNKFFSDGTPVTADLVIKSIERAIRLQGRAIAWAFGEVDGFTDFVDRRSSRLSGLQAVSSSEIKIRLSQPFAAFQQAMAAPYFAITKSTSDGKLLGTGAYRILKVVGSPGTELEFAL